MDYNTLAVGTGFFDERDRSIAAGGVLGISIRLRAEINSSAVVDFS